MRFSHLSDVISKWMMQGRGLILLASVHDDFISLKAWKNLFLITHTSMLSSKRNLTSILAFFPFFQGYCSKRFYTSRGPEPVLWSPGKEYEIFTNKRKATQLCLGLQNSSSTLSNPTDKWTINSMDYLSGPKLLNFRLKTGLVEHINFHMVKMYHSINI